MREEGERNPQDEKQDEIQDEAVRRAIEKIRAEMESRMEAMTERYEQRIRDLEARIGGEDGKRVDPLDNALDELEATLREESSTETQNLGQTTRFDPRFNPAFGLILDFSASAATLDDSYEDFNKFRLRVAELGVSARVDPYTWAYGVLGFGEDGTARVAELAAMLDLARFFPDSEFRLKGGRFLADLDPLNPVHEHEYPFVHQPAVKTEFFGGNLGGTGLELHHWFPLGEVPVRWSAGMLTDAEGHTHVEGSEHHQDHDAVEPLGKREFKDFQYTARLAASIPLNDEDSLNLGGSVFYAPRLSEFHEDAGPPVTVVREDTRRFVASVDASFKRISPDGDGFTLAVAGFQSHGQFIDELTGTRSTEDAYGLYSYLDLRLDEQWSVGAAVDWTQQADDHDQDISQYSAFAAWRLSPLNRLRLQVTYTDVDPGAEARFSEDFTSVFLQWTLILGAHAHGVDW